MAKTVDIIATILQTESINNAKHSEIASIAGITISEPATKTISIDAASTVELDFGGVASAKIVYFTANADITYQLDISGTPGTDLNPLKADCHFLEWGDTASGIVGVSITTVTEPTVITYYVA